VKVTEVAAAVIERPGGEFLLAQRPEGKPYPGYWEFPGGKIEPGETPEAALARELREELGIEAEIGRRLAVIRHTYQYGEVELQFFLVERYAGELANLIFQEVRWAPMQTLPEYAFLAADRELVHDLAEGKLVI